MIRLVVGKKLYKGFAAVSGRNNTGKLTCRHRGSGNKLVRRIISLKRNLIGVDGKVIRIVKDPNRSCYIAFVIYSNGLCGFVPAVQQLDEGKYFVQSKNGFLYSGVSRIGSSFDLKHTKEGEYINNVGLNRVAGGKVGRSAGSRLLVVKHYHETNKTLLQLPSGEYRLFANNVSCVVGMVSNPRSKLRKYYKAGQSRWLGRKPKVRGEAMNPVDHPHGGRTKGGRLSVSLWGQLTKGLVTRNSRLINRFIVKKRVKKHKK